MMVLMIKSLFNDTTRLSLAILGLLLLVGCSGTALAAIGGNEAFEKARQQQLIWQQAIDNFANADVDQVVIPYMTILTQLKTQPQPNWCRTDITSMVNRALTLNASSLVAYSMLYSCAAKYDKASDKATYAETINGLIGLIIKQKQASSLIDAIEIRELLEAPLILQAIGFNVLDMQLVLKNGGIYYHYHVIDPLTAKVHSKFFSNLAFMKHQLKQPAIGNEMAIQLILRAYRQQTLTLMVKYQASQLIEQGQYDAAIAQLDDIDEYSMLKNVQLGQTYLALQQWQKFATLSKALSLDAKAGFIDAAVLLGKYQVIHPDNSLSPDGLSSDVLSSESRLKKLIGQIDRFTLPGEGAYRLAQALLANNVNNPPLTKMAIKQSIKWFNQAIAQHHGKAAYTLARIYQAGKLIDSDANRAFALFKLAKDYGNAQAAIEVARYYHQGGTNIPIDHQQEMVILRKLIEQKNAPAMLLLGERYEYGIDVKQDAQQAYDWYYRAWQSGFAEAATQIAILYELGKISPQADESIAQAYVWYEKASQKGSHNGSFNLGRFYQWGMGRDIDLKQAAMFYLTAANNGSAISYCHLAVTLLQIDTHTGQARQATRDKALALYQLGIKHDNRICPRQLGHFYLNELSEPDNALHWYTIAARAGDAMAQFNLGEMYQQGAGIKADFIKGLSLIKQAADAGFKPAIDYLQHESL
jgi:TPR repeat protein